MKTTSDELQEKLIRVRASRRGVPVEIRVHYEIDKTGNCDTYRIFVLEDVE